MTSRQSITVGLLISTYNWPEALERILESVLQQTHMPDELLIADDGSGEETRWLINRYRSLLNIPVKHAWHEDQGFRKSLILNKAVKLADADYIIEIDGDIVLHPRFIEDHLRHAEPGRFVQGSRAILSKQLTGEMLRDNQLRPHFLSQGVRNRFNAIRFPALSFLIKARRHSSSNTKACNLAFWRKDFMAINGYNNLFNGWGAEDYEFAARLIHAGIYKKRLKLAAVCFHLHHECSSRSQFEENQVLYLQTVNQRAVFCANGYAQT